MVFSRESVPLGTGGAVKNAAPLIKSDPFVVLNGDSFCRIDYPAFLAFHLAKKALATLVISAVEDKRDYGSIFLDQTKQIVGFLEKDKHRTKKAESPYASAGIYCFQKDILSVMPKKASFSLEEDLFPRLVKKGLFGFAVEEAFIDIGTPQRYQQAKGFWKGRLA